MNASNDFFPADVFAKIIVGGDLAQTNELQEPWRSTAQAVMQSNGMSRIDAFRQRIEGRADADVLLESVFAVDSNLKSSGKCDFLTADQILKTDWPQPEFVIPDLVTVGLGNLAGRPKLGKSFLGLQFAHSVGSNGMIFGRKVSGGAVLYFALEDTPRRLKDRMQMQKWPESVSVDFVTIGNFRTLFGDFLQGGSEKVAELIRRKKYRLVVIDTVSRLVPGDPCDPELASKVWTPLHETAHADGCAVLGIDHHRKRGSSVPDAIEDIIGSTVKGAIIDTALGLYRERGKPGARLMVTGRDIEEKTLALSMDWTSGCWQCEGNADEKEMSERKSELLKALKHLKRANLTAIANFVGKDKSNTRKRLVELLDVGKIKVDGEFYSFIE